VCKRCASMHAYVRACVCAISWMDMGGWVRVQALCFNACVCACVCVCAFMDGYGWVGACASAVFQCMRTCVHVCVRLLGWVWVGGCVCKRCASMHAYVRACVCALLKPLLQGVQTALTSISIECTLPHVRTAQALLLLLIILVSEAMYVGLARTVYVQCVYVRVIRFFGSKGLIKFVKVLKF